MKCKECHSHKIKLIERIPYCGLGDVNYGIYRCLDCGYEFEAQINDFD